MNDNTIEELAQRLLEAQEKCQLCEPLPSSSYPELSIDDAYRIQQVIAQKKVARGEKIVGWKVGAASLAARRSPAWVEPAYGAITDADMLISGESVSVSRFVAPEAEAEIAFVMSEDIIGPGVTVAQVLRATAGVMAALELPDLRVDPQRMTRADGIADQMGANFVVLGDRLVPVSEVDLRLGGVVLEKNGEIVGTATGAECFGTPAAIMVWLANRMAKYGDYIKAGQFVITGALIPIIGPKAGDTFTATFDRLGSVSAAFTV